MKQFLLRFAGITLVALLLYAFLRYVFWWLLPFLIAFGLCSAMEPVIVLLEKTLRFRRSFSAAILTLLVLFIAGGILSLLLSTLFAQATALLRELPQMLTKLPELVRELLLRFETYCALCPEWLQEYLDRALSHWAVRSSAALDALTARLLSLLTAFAAALPRLALAVVTTMLAVFYTSAAYPTILQAVRSRLSRGSLHRLRLLRSGATQSLGRWLRAELMLCTVTFCELLLGFLFLRQKFSLLLAFLITLVDALPVLGAGTVLVPWALASVLFGSTVKGALLFALYLCVLLVRNILEPKLMAQQAGLPPIASLAAMYLGFCLFGVAGMLLFPFLLLFSAQICRLHREDRRSA